MDTPSCDSGSEGREFESRRAHHQTNQSLNIISEAPRRGGFCKISPWAESTLVPSASAVDCPYGVLTVQIKGFDALFDEPGKEPEGGASGQGRRFVIADGGRGTPSANITCAV
jgi:hypothetical protein